MRIHPSVHYYFQITKNCLYETGKSITNISTNDVSEVVQHVVSVAKDVLSKLTTCPKIEKPKAHEGEEDWEIV